MYKTKEDGIDHVQFLITEGGGVETAQRQHDATAAPLSMEPKVCVRVCACVRACVCVCKCACVCE